MHVRKTYIEHDDAHSHFEPFEIIRGRPKQMADNSSIAGIVWLTGTSHLHWALLLMTVM